MKKLTPIIPAHPPAVRERPIFSLDALITAGLIIAVMVGGDLLVANPPDGLSRYGRLAWRLLDSPVHAIQALLIVTPLVLYPLRRTEAWRRLLFAGSLAVLIDLDHFVAAHSLSFTRALHLWSRPDTHSLFFAVAVGLVAGLLSRQAVYGWIGFAALAGHILYDATSGSTPFLWPIPSDLLPAPIAYSAILAIYFATRAIARIAGDGIANSRRGIVK